jgi:hypothetical protein
MSDPAVCAGSIKLVLQAPCKASQDRRVGLQQEQRTGKGALESYHDSVWIQRFKKIKKIFPAVVPGWK